MVIDYPQSSMTNIYSQSIYLLEQVKLLISSAAISPDDFAWWGKLSHRVNFWRICEKWATERLSAGYTRTWKSISDRHQSLWCLIFLGALRFTQKIIPPDILRESPSHRLRERVEKLMRLLKIRKRLHRWKKRDIKSARIIMDIKFWSHDVKTFTSKILCVNIRLLLIKERKKEKKMGNLLIKILQFDKKLINYLYTAYLTKIISYFVT